MRKNLIFINPWIYDFAAYDLWSKPLGLLYIISYLRQCGFDTYFIDCLDIYNPYMKNSGLKKPKRRIYGTGKFWKERISLPPALKKIKIKRPYSRYGITPEILETELKKLSMPHAFIVTSLMTYWYPGVTDVIKIIKKIYPKVPVLLGGIYTRLCNEHATLNTGADIIITSSLPEDILNYLKELDIYPDQEIKFNPSLIYPAFDLYKKLDYICIITSKGCPYKCSYCASPFLNPKFNIREPEDVFEEINYWHKEFGIIDFAFYDDALLISADTHLLSLLEMIIKNKFRLRFHTPNALHIKEINQEIADLMYKAGFKTIRLGLESIDINLHKKLDKKLEPEDFEKAVTFLFKAGFKSHQIGAYILIGLPNQDINSIIETIKFVGKMKVIPFLAEYSPIPHTPLWKEAVRISPFDIASEPLYHNNVLIPCWDENNKKEIPKLKKMIFEIRQNLIG